MKAPKMRGCFLRFSSFWIFSSIISVEREDLVVIGSALLFEPLCESSKVCAKERASSIQMIAVYCPALCAKPCASLMTQDKEKRSFPFLKRIFAVF